jgi:SagB-type dehydrogenase family enzyme
LEIYVLALRVAGLPRSAFKYDPFGDFLELVSPEEGAAERIFADLRSFVGHTEHDDPPAVALLLTAVFGRTLGAYRHGLSLIYKDVGCLLQTFYLVATALGLGGVAVGGGYRPEHASMLGLDPKTEGPVGCFLLGHVVDER